MADIINFHDAKKETTRDKVNFLNDILVNEHKSILRHVNEMLMFEKTKLIDKSTKENYVIEISGGTLFSCNIVAAKNKSNYQITLIDYEKLKYGTETIFTLNREKGTSYEVTKKRKRVINNGKFIEYKYTKGNYSNDGKLIARITYIRDEKNTILFQENVLSEDKRLVNVYGYDDKLNLTSMLRGLKKENGYIFFDGYLDNLRVPEDKALFSVSLKNVITRKIKYVVRPARTNKLEVITPNDLDLLNNKGKVIEAIKEIPKLSDHYKEAYENFDGLKKYLNEFDEEVLIIRQKDGNLYTFTKKNAPIFDVQAEKYKCFYENDFLNPNNIVTEVECLTYPLVPIDELVITKMDVETNIILRRSTEVYEDDFLLLKRIKDDIDGYGDESSVIQKSEYCLETNDSYKKQIFDKKVVPYGSYDEYTYICNPEDDKVGFKFVTREYFDDSIREVFAFGKIRSNNTFKSINSIFARKNSLFDALILKSEDSENMLPDRVLMDFGKVATSDVQLRGMEYFDYQADQNDPDTLIYVDANRLTKFLDDFDEVENRMLKKYKDFNKKEKSFISEALKNDLIKEIKKATRKNR
ncbi:MAG: hypothetical protein MJ244_03490 [Clostridia bacterium]|nr:hypothetical protein [Clostridia bacterium]